MHRLSWGWHSNPLFGLSYHRELFADVPFQNWLQNYESLWQCLYLEARLNHLEHVATFFSGIGSRCEHFPTANGWWSTSVSNLSGRHPTRLHHRKTSHHQHVPWCNSARCELERAAQHTIRNQSLLTKFHESACTMLWLLVSDREGSFSHGICCSGVSRPLVWPGQPSGKRPLCPLFQARVAWDAFGFHRKAFLKSFGDTTSEADSKCECWWQASTCHFFSPKKRILWLQEQNVSFRNDVRYSYGKMRLTALYHHQLWSSLTNDFLRDGISMFIFAYRCLSNCPTN